MAALAYPLVVFLLGLIALAMFKQPLTRFLDRAKKIGPSGLEADPSASQQVASGTNADGGFLKGDAKDILTALEPFRSDAMRKREAEIREDLDKKKILGEERERLLIDLIAVVVMNMNFDQIYKIIFGSQILLLQEANTGGERGVALARAQGHYDHAAAAAPEIYQNF